LYFELTRRELLNPLKILTGIVEQRQVLPILCNILVRIHENRLYLSASDTEVEVTCSLPLPLGCESGETTIPARKLFDICSKLPESAQIQFLVEQKQTTLKSLKSRFVLAGLPASDFPASPNLSPRVTLSLSQKILKELLSKTQYGMSKNDVRHYLNGVCLDLREADLFVAATDGHRLAVSSMPFELNGREPLQAIIPRKTVTELVRLLDNVDNEVMITLDDNHIKLVISDEITVISKLIDGRYPDYQCVIPRDITTRVLINRVQFKSALGRAIILSDEQIKGVGLTLSNNLIKITASNRKDNAEEELEVEQTGEGCDIGFNCEYLLQALDALGGEKVALCFTEAFSSLLITPADADNPKAVIMPLRL
jgi:DNA polymerase-3 subunit beta